MRVSVKSMANSNPYHDSAIARFRLHIAFINSHTVTKAASVRRPRGRRRIAADFVGKRIAPPTQCEREGEAAMVPFALFESEFEDIGHCPTSEDFA